MNYLKINSNDQLDLIGSCLKECTGKTLAYSYIIYNKNTFAQFTNSSYFYQTGQTKSDLTILSDLLLQNTDVLELSVELILNLTTIDNQQIIGSTKLSFYVNQPPIPGTCDIMPKNGTTSDWFNIYCDLWTDAADGTYVNYTFYGNYFFKIFESEM